jgi:alpha-L-fucosidase 2
MSRILLTLAVLLLTHPVAAADRPADEVEMILARSCVPKSKAGSGGRDLMGQHPLLGNGSLTPVVMLERSGLRVPLGMTEFWRGNYRDPRGKVHYASPALAGTLLIALPGLAGWTADQWQDMHRAQAVATWTQGDSAVTVRTTVPRGADNFLVSEIENRSASPVAVEVSLRADPFDDPEMPFDVKSGQEGPCRWVSRRTYLSNWTVLGGKPYRIWAAVATRIPGAEDCRIEVPPGKIVRVTTKVSLSGIPATADPADPLPAALTAVNDADIEPMLTAHRAWWDAYWRRAYVRLDSEPLVERAYYGALYALACIAAPRHYPGGCNSFPVNDHVGWGGDYHWNYNHQATFYGAYSNNRIELTEPYDRTVLEANEIGRLFASEMLHAPGSMFVLSTTPQGEARGAITCGQKTNGLEALLNEIHRWRCTRDVDWAKRLWPVFRDHAAYWDWDLQQHKETRADGSVRYVVVGSGNMEFDPTRGYNAPACLAHVRRFYTAILEMSTALEASGFDTGVTEEDHTRWKRILAGLADYPLTFAWGRRILAHDEGGLAPTARTENQFLYPSFPADLVHRSSPPALRQVLEDSIRVRPCIFMQGVNTAPMIFTQAASVGVHPPEVLDRFKAWFEDLGVSNFKGNGGGNIECAGVAESVSRFLLQSQEGFLRLFPCWVAPDATFVSLRADKALLVSAERRNGVCQPVTVFSEKGMPCSVLNPWPGTTLRVTESGRSPSTAGKPSVPVPVTIEARPVGQICTFTTEPGRTYLIAPATPLPDAQAYWNAAFCQPVTTSTSECPTEPIHAPIYPPNPFWAPARNWSPAKLTDGVRFNTGYGSRGWSSRGYDDPDHAEWAQVDLGEAVSVREITLWPLDHGDAAGGGPNSPFFDPREVDQSYDGFPVDFELLISADGHQWHGVAKRSNYLLNPAAPDAKPRDVLGPERLTLERATPARFVKLVVTKLRQTRLTGKYAVRLAEIEVVRAEGR